MARRPRSLLPDGQFHLIAHAVGKERLFADDVDRLKFLGLLGKVAEEHDWRVRTFVLLDNHVHLLLDARAATLSPGLWWWHWRFAAHLGRRDPERRGHVFDSRPRTIPVTTERYSAAVLRYIARNPVEAGVCARPEGYRWSGHRALIGAAPPPPFLDVHGVLASFAPKPAAARAAYEAFVLGKDPPEHLRVARWVDPRPADRPALAALVSVPPTAVQLQQAAGWGYSHREIAAATGISASTVRRRLQGGTGGSAP